ncbi:hypothetical protein [Pseudodesulfovibrio pelocollis]|uniref:hypothetical protein n=1 Tax=Pseudodesulfovibrio pelocollis TaxID=3051432 RepID=UPI00255A79DD|nr:hypothetical protein [Pseudodesulfovibrio sp. SB368]
MAYSKDNLRLVGGFTGNNLFTYETDDALATVVASGYFTPAEGEYNLNAGDIIIAKTGDNTAIDLLLVNGVSPATVVNGT